jgi:hypothetical protein
LLEFLKSTLLIDSPFFVEVVISGLIRMFQEMLNAFDQRIVVGGRHPFGSLPKSRQFKSSLRNQKLPALSSFR